jgi:hypothetical protein
LSEYLGADDVTQIWDTVGKPLFPFLGSFLTEKECPTSLRMSLRMALSPARLQLHYSDIIAFHGWFKDRQDLSAGLSGSNTIPETQRSSCYWPVIASVHLTKHKPALKYSSACSSEIFMPLQR